MAGRVTGHFQDREAQPESWKFHGIGGSDCTGQGRNDLVMGPIYRAAIMARESRDATGVVGVMMGHENSGQLPAPCVQQGLNRVGITRIHRNDASPIRRRMDEPDVVISKSRDRRYFKHAGSLVIALSASHAICHIMGRRPPLPIGAVAGYPSPMPVYETHIQDWLLGPAGRRLREVERGVAAERLNRVYGLQFLQVGRWGAAGEFLSYPATARRAMCDTAPGAEVDFIADPRQLPIYGQSVDALFLPHTLEMSNDPHQVLREADRVIAEGGRLLIMGFNPLSPLGIRRLLGRGAWPPGLVNLYSEGRIRDWLSLLNFDVTDVQYFRLTPERQQRGWRLPMLQGAYFLTAVKRVFVVTPMRKLWRRPVRVGARVPEPTARNRF